MAINKQRETSDHRLQTHGQPGWRKASRRGGPHCDPGKHHSLVKVGRMAPSRPEWQLHALYKAPLPTPPGHFWVGQELPPLVHSFTADSTGMHQTVCVTGGGGDKPAPFPACKSKAPPACTHHRKKEPLAMAEGAAGKKCAR